MRQAANDCAPSVRLMLVSKLHQMLTGGSVFSLRLHLFRPHYNRHICTNFYYEFVQLIIYIVNE